VKCCSIAPYGQQPIAAGQQHSPGMGLERVSEPAEHESVDSIERFE
jgi:hypothetical protein